MPIDSRLLSHTSGLCKHRRACPKPQFASRCQNCTLLSTFQALFERINRLSLCVTRVVNPHKAILIVSISFLFHGPKHYIVCVPRSGEIIVSIDSSLSPYASYARCNIYDLSACLNGLLSLVISPPEGIKSNGPSSSEKSYLN